MHREKLVGSMMKKAMIKAMDQVMLNCEDATFLVTKSDFVKIGCMKRIQLKMHLAGCALCRQFKKQNDIINQNMKLLEAGKELPNSKIKTLSSEKKIQIQNVLKEIDKI